MRGEGCFSRKYSGSKLIGTQKEDITFMQDLLDMTSGAFVTVVIAALGFNPLGAFAAGVLLGKILQYWRDGAPRWYPRYFCKSPFVSAPQRSGGYRVRDGNKVVHKMVCKRQSAELY